MFHTIIIVGNVGKDPEMRYTPSGQAVTSFSVATNRQYTTGSGEQVKETIWFRITTWGKQAEICNQYLKKGSKVLIEGRLTPDKNTGGPRIWNKQDGSTGASFDDVRLAGRGSVLIAGRRVPVVGSVCMDMITVDVTGIPVEPGEPVVILGADGGDRIGVDEMARAIGTIPYEILCRIGTRIERVYN